MAVYNGERYLQGTVDSVLAQEFEDFEFLIVNDGSSDGSAEMLEAIDDPRVRILNNEQNIGLTASLNRGLRAARGTYIARVDADDICHPQRLSRQVAFLDQHREYVICGTSYTLIDAHGTPVRRKIKDFDDFEIRWISQFRTPIEHSTAMFRAEDTVGKQLFYDETYRTAQDFDYWLRVLQQGKGYILADTLMQYRMHDDNITRSLGNSQKTNLKTIGSKNFYQSWPHLAAHFADFEEFLKMYHLEQPANSRSIRNSIATIEQLERTFLRIHNASPTERKWVRKQTSGILAEGILRKGQARSSLILALTFLFRARSYLIPLAYRYIEDKKETMLKSESV